MSRPSAAAGDEAAARRRLEAAYHARFGCHAPTFLMPDALAVEVMRAALAEGEPAAPEAWPHPGCNCA